MFPYGRLEAIFDYIKKHDYVSTERLVAKYNVTDRTIRNDIQEINSVLEKNGAVIKLKRKYGYYIEVLEHSLYESFLMEIEEKSTDQMELESSQDRIRYILNILLFANEYMSFNDIMDKVYISKNTLSNYIRTIKKILDKYHLEYISKQNAGIKIIGSEDDKRRCIMENVITCDFDTYITGFTKEERTLFSGIDLDYLKRITLYELKRRNIETSDYNLKNLIIHLALMIARVKNNNYMNAVDIETDHSIMCIIDSLCKEIEEHYDIAVSRGEKIYMYLHLVANTHMEAAYIDDEWLRDSIDKMLGLIYDNYKFDIRSDKVLLENLFRHLKSIFTSKSFGLNIRNPLLNTIKNNYPLAFEITLTAASKVFVTDPFTLNEEDVGYVAVHIGAAIEILFSKKMEKKSVILVCGSGQATTRMLQAKVNMYFQDKISIVKTASYNEYMNMSEEDLQGIDFAISTVMLNTGKLPQVTVDFALKNRDLELISRFLSKMNLDGEGDKSQFFHEDLFVKMEQAASKEELLNLLFQMLKDKDIVDEFFIDSVYEREKLGKTNMNDIFALAHPMRLCAKDTKVAVAVLNQPVVWNEDDAGNKETVQIVFLLAIKQGVQKDIEQLYDSMIEIVNDTKLQQKILNAGDFEEFSKVLMY